MRVWGTGLHVAAAATPNIPSERGSQTQHDLFASREEECRHVSPYCIESVRSIRMSANIPYFVKGSAGTPASSKYEPIGVVT